MNIKQDYLESNVELIKSSCKICKKDSEKEYSLFQNYFTFLGLPFFPLRKKVYSTCKNCSVIKELKYRNNTIIDDFEQELLVELISKNKSHFKVRYFWGSLLIVLFLSLILSLIFSLNS